MNDPEKIPFFTEFKGHLAVLSAKVIAVITLLDMLNWIEKAIAIIVAIGMGIWGVRHLKSRTELNKEKAKGERLRNEMTEQELYERRLKNLKV